MSWNDIFNFSPKAKKVILIGEVLMDVIQDKDSNEHVTMIGGSPFNISRNLSKLNIPNKFYGAVGNDLFGDEIIKQIDQRNMEAHINKTNKVTSFVKINKSTCTPVPSFHRTSDNYIYFSDELAKDIVEAKILHFTYWPISKEPSRSTILAAIDTAIEKGIIIGFDPNYHPALDDEINSGFNLIKELIKKVDIIKPSLDDSVRMFGERTVEQYLNLYEELGAKLIIMTLGKDGLVARYQGTDITLPSLANEVIDTTGAGDAFWCGLYSGITTGATIMESVNIGLQCSAFSLKEIGADINFPFLAEIKKIIRE